MTPIGKGIDLDQLLIFNSYQSVYIYSFLGWALQVTAK